MVKHIDITYFSGSFESRVVRADYLKISSIALPFVVSGDDTVEWAVSLTHPG